MSNIVGNITFSNSTEFLSASHPEFISGSIPTSVTPFLMKQSEIRESQSNTKIPECAGMTVKSFFPFLENIRMKNGYSTNLNLGKNEIEEKFPLNKGGDVGFAMGGGCLTLQPTRK